MVLNRFPVSAPSVLGMDDTAIRTILRVVNLNGVKLTRIRAHNGSQRKAFEEMTYQLFASHYSAIGMPVRREGEGGDSGLEGYIENSAGDVLVGHQAKFFDEKLGSKQWTQVDDSVRTALESNKDIASLREYVIAIPRNLNSTQRTKWNALKSKWANYAKGIGYLKSLKFTLWGESELLLMLLHERNHGVLSYWFGYPDFNKDRCKRLTRRTIERLEAHERYLPKLHVRTTAEDKLHVFLRSERFRQEFLKVAQEQLRHRQRVASSEVTDWPRPLKKAFRDANMKWKLAKRELGDGLSLPRNLPSMADSFQAAAEALRPVAMQLRKLIPEDKKKETDPRRMSQDPREDQLREVERWQEALWTLSYFGRDHQDADRQFLLLSGQPGSGKTHLLAELCSGYTRDEGVAIFAEAGTFLSGASPWVQFLQWADFHGSIRDFLGCVSSIAVATDRPALICLDALNETRPRSLWQHGLEEFATEFREFPNVKLLVSCRNDYLSHTIPEYIREAKSTDWAIVMHEGLGAALFEAAPKYFEAYRVRGVGVPPLAREFQVPLLLKTFCEAFADQEPPPGSLTLSRILDKYLSFKSKQIALAVDCHPSTVKKVCRQLAIAISEAKSLWISEEKARSIALSAHPIPEESRSLYRALISEGILAEYPVEDTAASESTVRFTYERVWDYMIGLELLGVGKPLDPPLLENLRTSKWRHSNYGVIGIFALRLPEEGRGELPDVAAARADFDVMQAFVNSLAWRTKASWSDRTTSLMNQYAISPVVRDLRELQLSFAPNPKHPLNADHLHSSLISEPLDKRDREWTLWLNERIWYNGSDSIIEELLGWAEKADPALIPEEQVFLLATTLAWFLTTTVVAFRERTARALGRLLVQHISVTTAWIKRFIDVNDPYVLERVLMVGSGVAERALPGDPHLSEMAHIVHTAIFAHREVEPNILIREYAQEICKHAQDKKTLPSNIEPASFRPPFRSGWPAIWTEKQMQSFRSQCDKKFEQTRNYERLLHSTNPEQPGFMYGDWGRYVMGGIVHHFQSRRLGQPPDDRHGPRFDACVCQRYVVQKAVKIGLSPDGDDQPLYVRETGRWPTVERLGKKYQWIALHEFVGYLADHFHFDDYTGSPRPFTTARQLTSLRDLLDSHIPAHARATETSTWSFIPSASPWWLRVIRPLNHPFTPDRQKQWIMNREAANPAVLLSITNAEDEWITLSGFWEWKEPQPIERAASFHDAYLGLFWMARSFVVESAKKDSLLDFLSARDYEFGGTLQFDEPAFSAPISSLRDFPKGQTKLTSWCRLDEHSASGVWSSTCRYESHEDSQDALSGSLPSPQFMKLGKLQWMGRDFDFGNRDQPRIVRFSRYKRSCACHIQKDALLRCLARGQKTLVWRLHGEKNRYAEPHGECHQRRYWASYELTKDGNIICYAGATHLIADRVRTIEPLPWPSTDSSYSDGSLRAMVVNGR